MHPVFVLGLYFPGIDALRHFRARGIPCLGFAAAANSPGLKIRGVKTILVEDPKQNPQTWYFPLVEFAQKYKVKPVLLISSDLFVAPVYDEPRLREHFLFPETKDGLIPKLSSKSGLYELAKEQQMPQPFTLLVKDKEADYGALKYPCVLKPIFPDRWRTEAIKSLLGEAKVLTVKDEEELKQLLAKVTPYDEDLIIQEMIPGCDENLYYFVCHVNSKHDITGWFCGQKLRITPIHFGSASYMRTVSAAPFYELCKNFLKQIGYVGVCGIEFKKDERDGSFKLIEINARFGLWDVIGKKLDVNVFQLYYDDLIGNISALCPPKEKTWYWVSLTRDIPNYLHSYRKEGLSLYKWLLSYLKKIYFSDVYLDEPAIMNNLYWERIKKKILE